MVTRNARSHKSTTGRLSLPQRAALLGLPISATVAPEVAARWAASLFATPRRFERPEEERAELASARAFRFGGLAGWRWGTGPGVFLAHGWEGRGAQLIDFVPGLVARGYSVYAFDARAHGASPGREATLADFSAALLALEERVGSPEGVIAHSFGSLGALLAVRRGLRTRSLALIAPPSPGEHVAWFQKAFQLPDDVVRSMVRRIEERVGASLTEVEAPALAAGLAVPALLLHDLGDKEASYRVSARAADALEDGTLVLTEGLGHRRILKDPVVVRRAVDFVARHAAQRAESPELKRLEPAEPGAPVAA